MPKIVVALVLSLLAGCSREYTADEYLASAVSYVAQGNYEEAMVELKMALQLEPEQPQARCLLGKVHLENGNFLDAEKELTRARELGCAASVANLLLAEALLPQGRFADLAALDTATMSPEGLARLLSLKSEAALATGEQALAEELVERAETDAPESADTQLARARLMALQGDADEALSLISKVLEAAPENPDAWRLRGYTLWRLARLPEARTAFDKAIEHTSFPLADHVSRGLINLLMEDFRRAQKDAAALNEIAPHDAGSAYINGLLLFRSGQYRDAITTLALGEPAEAKYPLLLFYLSLAHVIEGDPAVAETYAVKYVELVPNSIEGRKLLGLLLVQRGAGDKAEAVLQPVLDHNPADIGALNLRANALLLDDRADLALVTYRVISLVAPTIELADLVPTSGLLTPRQAMGAGAALQRAVAPFVAFPREDVLFIFDALKQRKFEEAITAASSYKFRDLTGIAPYNVLGVVHEAAGDLKQARIVYRQALKRDPGNPSASLKLAQIEREMNELKKERQLYQDVLAVHPEHLLTMLRLAALDGHEGDKAEMIDVLEAAIDVHETALEPRLRLAQHYSDTAKPEKVDEIFASLPDLQKRSSRVRELSVKAYLQQGKLKEALAYSRKAFAVDPNTQTLLGLVGILKKAKQDSVLRDTIAHWLGEHPADVVARLRLAEEFEAIDTAAANEHYEEILRQQPGVLVALNNLAWNLRTKDTERALTHIRRAAEIAPNNADILDTLAVVEHISGNNEEALVHIQRALKHNTTNLSMRYHEAMINAALGNTKRAIVALHYLLVAEDDGFDERADAHALLTRLEQSQ